MGKIPSSDPDWLLDFPLFTSSPQFLENASMTVHPLPPFGSRQLWFSPGCKDSSCINTHILSTHQKVIMNGFFANGKGGGDSGGLHSTGRYLHNSGRESTYGTER